MVAFVDIETVALTCFNFFDGGVPAGLLSLTTLDMMYQNEYFGFDTEAIVPFMTLPNLRSFSVERFSAVDDNAGSLHNHSSVRVCPTGKDHGLEFPAVADERMGIRPFPANTPYGFIMPAGCSSITHLKFRESSVTSSLLSRILTLPNQLESFECEIGGRHVGEEHFAIGVIFEGIQAQAPSLKRLIISIGREDREGDYKTHHFRELPENKRELGSLTKLVRLEHFSVPVDMLLGAGDLGLEAVANISFAASRPLDQLLPRSLVRLELKLTEDWELEFFLAQTGMPRTLQRMREALPALRTIIINYGHKLDGDADKVSQRKTAQWWESGLIPEGLELEIRYMGPVQD